jgi:putative addiction module component (TIGR02574 family)
MDLTAVLREVESWPIEDRIRLVQEVWDRIAAADDGPDLTAAEKAELDRRLAALDANPDDVISWEAIEEHVRRPR